MKASCLKQTLVPGTSRLFTDFLYNFDRVAHYYDWNPFDPVSFQGAAAAIDYPKERREAIVQALRGQNGSMPALDKLAQPGCVAIVTGQQVGLFGGPAYTVYKALTAVRLARKLDAQGIPAVPVFWLATEDHDLAEVDHVWIHDKAGIPTKLTSDVHRTSGPVGQAIFRDVPVEELTRAFEGFPFAEDVIALVKRSYQPGASLGSSFRELLGALLGDLGLIFLDPLDPAIRQIAAPFLQQALENASEIMDDLRARSEDLETAGYHAQVHLDQETSPVLLLDKGSRVALKFRDDSFRTKHMSYSTATLQARSSDVSPNALLRPVMQDFLLPTAVYVGGPAEVAYMAQAQTIYRKLLGRMPVIFPRNGFTLLSHRATKLMDRYQLQVPELLDYEEHVRSRMADKLVPPSLQEDFAKAGRIINDGLARLRSELTEFDATLSAAAEKSERKMLYQFQKLAAKTARETLRRNKQASSDADYVFQQIYPHRHLQERFYSILPFLAQYGFELLPSLLEETQLECPDHLVRSLSE